jgi:hypothetical protein
MSPQQQLLLGLHTRVLCSSQPKSCASHNAPPNDADIVTQALRKHPSLQAYAHTSSDVPKTPQMLCPHVTQLYPTNPGSFCSTVLFCPVESQSAVQ